MYIGVPIIWAKAVVSVRSVRGCSPIALATPKSIIFWPRLTVLNGHQHVGRLEVPVDDPFLMGVLNRLADRDEQFQPLAGREIGLVAIFRNGHAVDQLHHKVRAPGVRGWGLETVGWGGGNS